MLLRIRSTTLRKWIIIKVIPKLPSLPCYFQNCYLKKRISGCEKNLTVNKKKLSQNGCLRITEKRSYSKKSLKFNRMMDFLRNKYVEQ